jgi:ParB-like chromosome segregation protein Spo0J
MTEVPVMVAKGWSDAKKRAYVLADNRLALNAGWDNEMLALELAEIKELGFDLDLTGFKAEEIQALQTPDFEPGTEEDQGKLDELDPKWIACPHCGKEFDARQA